MPTKPHHGICPHCGERIPLPRLTRAMFQIVIKTLEAHRYNRTQTAAALGMPVRTLRNWIVMFRGMGFEIPPAPPWGKPVDLDAFVRKWARDPE